MAGAMRAIEANCWRSSLSRTRGVRQYYGYGCACMTMTTDSAQDRILAITSSKREPLATCQADPSLPAIIE